MSFDTTNATYRDLCRHINAGGIGVVPFVGAGLSVYGSDNERLPLWKELLDRLVAEGVDLGLISSGANSRLNASIAAGHYIETLDRIVDVLGEPTFKRLVERELDDTGRPIPPAITELVSVAWSLIVTTNLDRFIARAYLERNGQPIDAITSLDNHRLAAAMSGALQSAQTLLAQIHGALDVYPSWRLTQSHYKQLLQNPAYVEAIKPLFLRRVFFVGFGLQDSDLDLLFETVAAIYPAGVGEFYALLDSSRRHDPVVQQLIRVNGLRPIFYDVDSFSGPDDPFRGHRAAFECLEDLASRWASSAQPVATTWKYFPELDPNLVGVDVRLDELERVLLRSNGAIAQIVGIGGVGKTSVVQALIARRSAALNRAGYRFTFGCCMNQVGVGELIQDLGLATIGPTVAPLTELAASICNFLRATKSILILDGVETLLTKDRGLSNPYVQQIVSAAIEGGGGVVLTTRIPVRGAPFESAEIIDIEPWSDHETRLFMERWGFDHLGSVATSALISVTGGHPLALRVAAGVLHGVSNSAALGAIERGCLADAGDEADAGRRNRLSRAFDSYAELLSVEELALLDSSSVFDEPVPFSLVESTLCREYDDTDVNARLVGRDIRPIVANLVACRLLDVTTGGELSSHPVVRGYFATRVQDGAQDLRPLHRHLAYGYARSAADVPESFAEVRPLLAAARHAAASNEWSLFDDIFRRRLMRGSRAHLTDQLGAWTSALLLARLASDDSCYPAESTADPAYYGTIVARSLKHLGRSTESRRHYIASLKRGLPSRDPRYAEYANNFLTLLVWRGELIAAETLIELNMRALSWIDDDWRRRWQIEHGLSSIAYLKLLLGQIDASDALFTSSERAWDDYGGDRIWVWDHYPIHRAELLLLRDPTAHDAARSSVAALLRVAEERHWAEPMCRGFIAAALVAIDAARATGQRSHVDDAQRWLAQARHTTAGITVPDVRLSYDLTRLKLMVARHDLGIDSDVDLMDFDATIERMDALIDASGASLALAEVVAARGMLAGLKGSSAQAHDLLAQALSVCERQGNVLATLSPRSLVHMLDRALGGDFTMAASGSPELVDDMIGLPLTSDWALGCLQRVELDASRAHGEYFETM